jgi:hypothetical protein
MIGTHARFHFAALALFVCGALTGGVGAADAQAADAGMAIERQDDQLRVLYDGKLVTQYIFKGWRRPVMHPLVGPGGARMTRDFPIKKDTQGESSDHAHHQSLWFGHGDVNGTRFWKTQGKQVHQQLVSAKTNGHKATIKTRNHWLTPEGDHILTDERTITIRVQNENVRTLDYAVTLIADQGSVTFGDTKEGLMGIRTHPHLRLDGKHGSDGQAVNSQGTPGPKKIWGERAKWVNYWGTLDGDTMGIAIFDHPDNLRHPTWWHARDYGLVAANPFGISYFEGKPRSTGDYTLQAGDQRRLHYRFVFYHGRRDSQAIEKAYQRWLQADD